MIEFLGKSKVDQLEVPLRINEHVLRLHVSIGNALALMKKFQDQDHFGHVEAGGWLIEARGSPEVSEDLSTWTVVKLVEVSNGRHCEPRCHKPACTDIPGPRSW